MIFFLNAVFLSWNNLVFRSTQGGRAPYFLGTKIRVPCSLLFIGSVTLPVPGRRAWIEVLSVEHSVPPPTLMRRTMFLLPAMARACSVAGALQSQPGAGCATQSCSQGWAGLCPGSCSDHAAASLPGHKGQGGWARLIRHLETM